MQELLFKAKRMDNGEWIYWNIFSGLNVRIDFDTICQYTGLTTKSGHKVWTNDIIKHHYGEQMAAIKFGSYQIGMDTRITSHCGFYVDWNERVLLRKDLGYWIEMGVEVVGNSIDNPELIGGEENGN